MQGLLEHVAREYQKVDIDARGPALLASASARVGVASTRSNGPISSGSADPEEQSPDHRRASNRGNGSDSSKAGTPSRKRQRVGSGPHELSSSPSSPGRELDSRRSEDGLGGVSAGESYGGDRGAVAGQEEAGTNELLARRSIHFRVWKQMSTGCCKSVSGNQHMPILVHLLPSRAVLVVVETTLN